MTVLNGASATSDEEAAIQLSLVGDEVGTGWTVPATFSTRFQGSKKRILPWLIEVFSETLPVPNTVLDAFAGSGTMAYAFARQGAHVTSCERLLSGHWSAYAFLAGRTPSKDTVEAICVEASDFGGDAVSDLYQGVFYHDAETKWLEGAALRASQLPEPERAVVYWALFQAALAKRPYNLFHRANLDMRTREVTRSFGNKTTWERPFPDHFRKFIKEAAGFVPKSAHGVAQHCDPLLASGTFDLVYIDPPYMNARGQTTPYADFYSFLDVLIEPELIRNVDMGKAHKPLIVEPTKWDKKATIPDAFRDLFVRFTDSAIAVSYRSDGFPTIEAIADLLGETHRDVSVWTTSLKYALSRTAGSSEVIIVGKPNA